MTKTIFNMLNCAVGNAILRGYVSVTETIVNQFADVPHIIIAQFGLGETVTHRSVAHVIGLGAQIKVLRSHTRGVITGMQNVKVGCGRAIGEAVSQAVRKAQMAVSVAGMPVALPMFSSCPNPTLTSKPNLSPKAFGEIGVAVGTLAGTIEGSVRGGSAEVVATTDTHVCVGLPPAFAGIDIEGKLDYTFHVKTSYKGVGRSPAVIAARGFIVPNYTTFGGWV